MYVNFIGYLQFPEDFSPGVCLEWCCHQQVCYKSFFSAVFVFTSLSVCTMKSNPKPLHLCYSVVRRQDISSWGPIRNVNTRLLTPRTKGRSFKRLTVCRQSRIHVRLVRKLPNQTTWKFRTMLRPQKSITVCSIMTSSQTQDGGRPLTWKSLCRQTSVKNDPIVTKFGKLNQVVTLIEVI